MFTPTNTQRDFLKALKANEGSQIVIHYNCSNCDDEQVTYAQEYEQKDIDKIKSEKCLYLHIPCTECGHNQIAINGNKNISGIETV